MDANELRQHKLTNALQTLLLIITMALTLGLLGWSLFGVQGLIVALLICLALMILGPRVSPTLVLRMYQAREIDPRQAADLYRVVAELSRRADLQPPRLYYVPTPMLNAFAVGKRAHSAIAVTAGLLNALSGRELTGVLAHEISHIRHNDMWVMNLADVISRLTVGLSQLGIFAIPLLLLGFITLPALILLFAAPTAVTLLQLALSRTREYDADRGAAELTGDPAGLASALSKLERQQGGWLERIVLPGRREPDPAVLRTHPPTAERVRRLQELGGQVAAARALLSQPELTVPPNWPVLRPQPRWHLNGLWY